MSRPELEKLSVTPVNTKRYMTVIFNNDHNSLDEVMLILMRATGCSKDEAYVETWEAHHYGKAPVHFASEAECKKVASIIESIGVLTDVRPEWND